MPVSARILGESYGLNAQEMNLALVKNGVLEGEPGAYRLTEKGKLYAHEKDNHRGPGGYSWYNRDWTTVSYDKAIKNELRITPAMKAEIREELSARRAAQRASCAKAMNAAEEAFLNNRMAQESERSEAHSAAALSVDLDEAAKYGFLILCAAAACYGLYKLCPVVKQWWKKRREQRRRKLSTGQSEQPSKRENESAD